MQELFGPDTDELARADLAYSGGSRTVSTAENSPYNEPASFIAAHKGLLDPQGSAMFWIAVAAVLGLIIVTGQLRVEAALGGRAGRRGR